MLIHNNQISGDQTIPGSFHDDTIFSGPGDDQIWGDPQIASIGGNDTIVAGSGDDTVTDYHGDNYVIGGAGNDLITEYSPSTTIDSGTGDDYVRVTGVGLAHIVLGDGNDDATGYYYSTLTLLGGAGDDTLGGSATKTAWIDGGPGDDVIGALGAEHATLLGGAGNDRISSQFAHTIIDGGIGDDTLTPDGPDDVLHFHWAQSTSGATVSYLNLSGVDTVYNFNPVADHLTFDGISQLDDFLRHVTGVNVAGHVDLAYDGVTFMHLYRDYEFEAGARSLTYAGGWFVKAEGELVGPAPDATLPPVAIPPPDASPPPVIDPPTTSPPGVQLTGTVGADSIVGTAGSDSIAGKGGDDTILAGGGGDTVVVSPATTFEDLSNVKVDLGDGNDTLTASAQTLAVNGGPGRDLIRTSSSSSMFIDAGSGDDAVQTYGTGDGTLLGGAGDDEIYAQYGHNLIDGGSGDDIIMAYGDYDNLGLGFEQFGDAFDNYMAHSTGHDVIDLHWAQTTTSGGSAVSYQNLSGVDTVYKFAPEPYYTHPGDGLRIDGISNVGDFLQHVTATNLGDHVDLAFDGATFVHLYGGNVQGDFGLTYSTSWFVDANGQSVAPPPPPTPSPPPLTTPPPTTQPVATDDRLTGTSSAESLNGGLGDDTLTSNGGQDTLWGGDGNDSISGGADWSVINGNKGEDTIVGRSQAGDWLSGGQGNDLIDARVSSGRNFINGNLGQDTVQGGEGGDTLLGGQGADLIHGGNGADYLAGNRGDDTLTGGGGADAFHFGPGTGADVITDFDGAGGDRIRIDDGATSFTVSQTGSDVLIQLGSGDSVTLRNAAGFDTGWIGTA